MQREGRSARTVGAIAAALAACALAGCSSSSKPATTSLTGSLWQLGSFRGSGGDPAPAATGGSAATLTFAKGARVAGSTGCNAFTGTYRLSASRLTISPELTTRTPCPNTELQAQENAINRQLPQVRNYDVTDDVLKLTGETGQTLLTYNRRSS